MQNFVARGTINPCRFVIMSSYQDNAVEQAGANGLTAGIAQQFEHDAPIPNAGTDAASSGESIKVYDIGDTCLLELGGTVERAGLIKSDTDGKGVAIATSGTTIQQIGARAYERGVSGNLIRVQVLQYSERPALA